MPVPLNPVAHTLTQAVLLHQDVLGSLVCWANLCSSFQALHRSPPLKVLPEVTASWNKVVLVPLFCLWVLYLYHFGVTACLLRKRGTLALLASVSPGCSWVSGLAQNRWSSRVYGTHKDPGMFCK